MNEIIFKYMTVTELLTMTQPSDLTCMEQNHSMKSYLNGVN